MKYLFLLLFTFLFLTTSAQSVDSIFAKRGHFKSRGLVSGTRYWDTYKVSKKDTALILKKTQEIREGQSQGKAVYHIRTTIYNVAHGDSVEHHTRVDGENYALLWSKSVSGRDSAEVSFNPPFLSGWIQPASGTRAGIMLQFDQGVFIDTGHTPWLPGLVKLDHGMEFYIPAYYSFSNIINWDYYRVTGMSPLAVNGKTHACWMLSYWPGMRKREKKLLWIDIESGVMVKSITMKDGYSTYYSTELSTK